MATQVGLNNLYYAILQKDDSTGAVYQTPVKIAPAINAKISRKSSSSVLYADDGASQTATAIGEVELEIETSELSNTVLAELLGHTISNGAMVRKSTDVAPDVAVGFSSVKSNGKRKFVWLYKGKFLVPDDEFKTKGDKVDFQTPKIKAVFVKRDFDNGYERTADEEDTNYYASVGTNWFLSVEGTPDTTAPTVFTTPANNATAVSYNMITWTFSEAIQASTVNKANFIVQKADGSAQAAGTLSLSADKTTVTYTPSTNFTAATQYMAIATVGVKDLAGNAMANTSVVKFTTA